MYNWTRKQHKQDLYHQELMLCLQHIIIESQILNLLEKKNLAAIYLKNVFLQKPVAMATSRGTHFQQVMSKR